MKAKDALNAIIKKIPFLSCSACGGSDLRIQTKFIVNIMNEDPGLLDLTCHPHAIPTLPIICSWCGNLSQHALFVFDGHGENL